MKLPRTEQDVVRIGEKAATGSMRLILNVSWAFEWFAGRLMIGTAWGLLILLMVFVSFYTDDTIIGLVQGERQAAVTLVFAIIGSLIVWRILTVDRAHIPNTWRRPPGEGEWW
ncbi:hypothetical protein [Marinivivus vitaminiproducens]|uniref:hypothetical protein n=1 Tax=Marinivivus vitaminiproducens TaxID=3035935 RepID=UPI0027A52E40|nr:hypothetical protein P4R82_24570 [Geminicoccaceae bacterium SCSIO 64248]